MTPLTSRYRNEKKTTNINAVKFNLVQKTEQIHIILREKTNDN